MVFMTTDRDELRTKVEAHVAAQQSEPLSGGAYFDEGDHVVVVSRSMTTMINGWVTEVDEDGFTVEQNGSGLSRYMAWRDLGMIRKEDGSGWDSVEPID